MFKIYHNQTCSKSREGVAILKESGRDFEIVDFMNYPLSFEELKDIIKKLGINPIDLVRKNEPYWERFKDQRISDAQIIEAMVENPELIERPIVITQNKAIIGRPPVLIKELL